MATNLVNPNYSAFDLDILLKNIYEEAKVIVPKEKQIELIYVSPKKRAGIIESDAVKLKQVLTNLITNAIKFTDKGCVKFGYNLNNSIEFSP
jgi:signal transduction histidine kinase